MNFGDANLYFNLNLRQTFKERALLFLCPEGNQLPGLTREFWDHDLKKKLKLLQDLYILQFKICEANIQLLLLFFKSVK